MASKYEPFGRFLRGGGDEIRLDFSEIEALLGAPLPPMARRQRGFWSNNPSNNVMTRVWIDAGFRTERVDLAGETVVFRRHATESAAHPAPLPHPLAGAMAGTATLAPDLFAAVDRPPAATAAPLLLDAVALVALLTGSPLSTAAIAALGAEADAARPLRVSPIAAWQIGRLVALGRLALSMSPAAWFRRATDRPEIICVELAPATLIAASFLPGTPPPGAAERILIATARDEGLTLLCRDMPMLDYAAGGHVAAIAC